MKLLPFDLEKAQSGHPWGTRDGRKGKKIFDTEIDGCNRLIAILEDGGMPWCGIDGKYFKGEMEAELDLFLYEETKKGWVVISVVNGYLRVNVYHDQKLKEAEESQFKLFGTYLKTVEVEY